MPVLRFIFGLSTLQQNGELFLREPSGFAGVFRRTIDVRGPDWTVR
jgi:hypothetical protein